MFGSQAPLKELSMQRYRVHIVPRTGRFAPLLTVLVEAESRDEAFQIAQLRCTTSKVVSAEGSEAEPESQPRLRVLADSVSDECPVHALGCCVERVKSRGTPISIEDVGLSRVFRSRVMLMDHPYLLIVHPDKSSRAL